MYTVYYMREYLVPQQCLHVAQRAQHISDSYYCVLSASGYHGITADEDRTYSLLTIINCPKRAVANILILKVVIYNHCVP